MKIISSIFLFFFISAVMVFGQELSEKDEPHYRDEKIPFKDRIYIGGNMGMQFGTITFIDVSPIIGYKFSDRISAGPGLIYQYYNFRGLASGSNFGGRFFGRYHITENMFTYSEYEYLNVGYYSVNGDYSRKEIKSLFIGGGYNQRIGTRASMTIMVLYNLIYSPYSPYTNPIIRVGINAGI